MLPREFLASRWRGIRSAKAQPTQPTEMAGSSPLAVIEDGDVLRLRGRAYRLRTTVPLFSELDTESLVELSEHFQPESFHAGVSVIHQGEKGDKFYILLEGTAEVLRAVGGMESPLAILQDGSFFGEMALLSRVPRTATVRARTTCSTLSLERHHFDQLIARHGHIRQFLEVVAHARAHEDVHRQVYGWAINSHHQIGSLTRVSLGTASS
jgi:CRP-like cAMP-binding protein